MSRLAYSMAVPRTAGREVSGRAAAGPGRPGLLLGPLAVDPDCRSRDIGAALMGAPSGRRAAAAIAKSCWRAMSLVTELRLFGRRHLRLGVKGIHIAERDTQRNA
jgi:GNAT superfamily N-acetyltransferase